MFSPLERMVAFRYLRARRQEGFISVIAWFSLLGIMLGVATLIIVMAVMNGFRHELLGRVLGINGHLTISAGPVGLNDYVSIIDGVMKVDGVVMVTPLVEGQVMATANGVASGAIVRGVRKQDFLARDTLANSVKRGDLSRFNDGQGIIMGSRMAQKMGLTLGDKVKLISPNGTSTAFGTVPRTKSYEIDALFDIGMYEYDSTFIFMPLAEAQLYFQKQKAVTAIEVMVTSPEIAPDLRTPIASVVGPAIRVQDWQRTNASFFTALQVERNVMFLILTLIIVVAAFNVISSQIMLVNDKAKGIAIMRTIGASRAMMMRIFFMTGSSVGLIGTSAGAALGIAFALNIEQIRQWIQSLSGTDLFSAEIYFLSRLPARIDSVETIMVVAMALSLSFLASIYPAWRAARLDPVDVLRYE
jgi:lipoprotein-releasing system permease protein